MENKEKTMPFLSGNFNKSISADVVLSRTISDNIGIEKVIYRCGSICMITVLSCLALGFTASFISLIYLIVRLLAA